MMAALTMQYRTIRTPTVSCLIIVNSKGDVAMRRRPAEYRYDARNSGISTTITKMVFCRNLALPSKLTMTIVNFSIVVANKRDDPQVLTTSINEYQRIIAMHLVQNMIRRTSITIVRCVMYYELETNNGSYRTGD